MIVLAVLISAVVSLLDPLTLIVTLLAGFWWPRGLGLALAALGCGTARFVFGMVVRDGPFSTLDAVVVVGGFLGAVLGVLLGAGLCHLLERMRRRA